MSRLIHISDGEPAASRRSLRAAARARGVEFVDVRAPLFDHTSPPAPPGTLLYRSATSLAAQLVARHLWQPGVATLDTGGDVWPVAALERAGVPVVVEVPCATTERGTIRRAVAALGGFPVVVRVGAGEGGVGVVLTESWAALVSLLDHLLAENRLPRLSRLVPDARHWRCVVLGGRCVASHRGAAIAEDFRTRPPRPDELAEASHAPAGVAAAAAAAASTLGHELAGVDLLVDPAGEARVLEVNSPCAFGVAQQVTGVDIAAMMVERLIELARSPSPPPLSGARTPSPPGATPSP